MADRGRHRAPPVRPERKQPRRAYRVMATLGRVARRRPMVFQWGQHR